MPVSGKLPYDNSNIFARILRGELACNKIYENEFAFSFHDIYPQAPIHALVVPKGKYVSFSDFGATATAEEVTGFIRAVALITKKLSMEDSGYRIIANMGQYGHQEVPHLHMHILGGCQLSHRLALTDS
jgi:diadenosine tetraphosphate (Ap4A) HIT family hydrolase